MSDRSKFRLSILHFKGQQDRFKTDLVTVRQVIDICRDPVLVPHCLAKGIFLAKDSVLPHTQG